MDRKAPGLLLHDIQRGSDAQVRAVLHQIAKVQPDIIVLHRFDWDAKLWALAALRDQLTQTGLHLPHIYAPRPNSGVPTGVDVNGDGHITLPKDAQGFGRFPGNRGLAILSRFPISADQIIDQSHVLWADVPNTRSTDALSLANVQRMSSVAHTAIPIDINGTSVTVLTAHPTAPVFDGPDDRNGRRNADEIALLGRMITTTKPPFVVLTNLNLDPHDGAGIRGAVADLLALPHVQDPRPTSAGAQAAADPNHHAPPAHDTVDWPDGRPGNLRVSYALPSADLNVVASGVHWPVGMTPTASPHRIVWVDVDIP